MLQAALGTAGVQGTFTAAASGAAAGLAEHSATLLALLRAVLTDPLVDWSAEREAHAARKDMDVAGGCTHQRSERATTPLCTWTIALASTAPPPCVASCRLQHHACA
jgi:hypothetical protein